MLELDLSGLNCPLPVLKTKKFLAELASGTVVKVITTDVASRQDLRDFCEKTSHTILTQTTENNTIHTIITRR